MIGLSALILTNMSLASTQLESVKKIEEKLPQYDLKKISKKLNNIRSNKIRASYVSPYREVKLDEISQSGTELGAIRKGAILFNIITNEEKIIPKDIYVKYFNLQDESGFKYIQNDDGKIEWRISGRMLETLKEDLKLYEPPLIYTPAPVINKRTKDQSLTLLPGMFFFTGVTQGAFMSDLFNDKKASEGVSNQFGINLSTEWDFPIKIGAAVHFEKATYQMLNNYHIDYSSWSIGPLIRTRLIDSFTRFRAQLQFRIGPYASATSNIRSYDFNSNDLLGSIEFPFKNFLGEFNIGPYYQIQWLALKNQKNSVNLSSGEKTNNSFGIFLSQVFK